MKRFVTALLTLSLALSLCACFAEPERNMIQPTEVTAERILMRGYIVDPEVIVYAEPTENSEQYGFYFQGEYVCVYEIADGWGRTDWGWIRLDKIGDQLLEDDIQNDDQDREQDSNQGGGNQTQGNTPAQSAAPTQSDNGVADNTKLPPSDNNQAILGEWYTTDMLDDGCWIELVEFTSDGRYGKEAWTVYPPNWDQRIPNGGFSYDYATQGNTVYLRRDRVSDDDFPTVGTASFSVSGDTLSWYGSTYYRGGYDAALAAAKAQYGTDQETPAVPNTTTETAS